MNSIRGDAKAPSGVTGRTGATAHGVLAEGDERLGEPLIAEPIGTSSTSSRHRMLDPPALQTPDTRRTKG